MGEKETKKVLVVGAGTMGHSIAQVFATAGMDVNLVDADQLMLGHAIELITSNLDILAQSGVVKRNDIPSTIGRIHTFLDLAEAAREVDFAIEAVPERADIKKGIFSQLDQFLPQGVTI